MTKFHERTLALLGDDAPRPRRSVEALLDWGKRNDVALPAAFVEWAHLDDGSLLRKFSNDDWFWFDEPTIVVTPDGVRGLAFNTENQNNFDRIVALDADDDPPVLYAWVGEPPWIRNAERFSDAVYAQIFDWQYKLEFKSDDPSYKEIDYTGSISLPAASRCVDVFRRCYEETVTTRYMVDDASCTEYRFLKSPLERFTVRIEDSTGDAEIEISGRPMEAVAALEAQWLNVFGGEVKPTGFNSVGWAVDHLGHRIDSGWFTQLRHGCIEKPDARALASLVACHRTCRLQERALGGFPNLGSTYDLGGDDWGVTIRFRRRPERHGWWEIEQIIACNDTALPTAPRP
jgi:hypothetical protein